MTYSYKVVPFAYAPPQRTTRMDNLAQTAAVMERIVNEHAAVGWEFMSTQQVQLGDMQTHFDVLVFRASN